MKNILRTIIINFICFWLIAQVVPAVNYSKDLKILLLASLALWLVNFLVKPFLNLLFLPLNLITLGTFRWIINIIILYLVTVFVDGFSINAFVFPGVNFYGFIIPLIKFNLFWSYILVSFLIAFFTNIIYFLIK